uniref:NADH-ubiquinone oxidoreductase chain 2 n=1 Tax=Brasilocerus sp. 2 DTA-2012 TaxID=1176494 RepID=A0A0H3UL64_9COLE|nr:NADH dehydrogenase subunit 2 [Brasilocerus sp. 2 DTA-2012]
MMKTYKMMFLTLLMVSTLITISSYSWMSMWIGLEINLLSMVTLMNNDLLMNSPESMIKYYLIQAMSSSLVMMCIIVELMSSSFLINIMNESKTMIMMNIGLLIKMGTAPFHFWLPEVVEGIEWFNCFLILTWQKIAPMVMLMFNMEFNLFIMIIILTSLILSSILSFNQKSMRKILAYSSINHMGWMLASMFTNKTIWLIYLIVYFILMINLTSMMNMYKIFYINQLNNLNMNMFVKSMISMNFLSLAGIPPFIGFLPKWLIIQVLIENKMFMLSLIFTIVALIMIFVYIRISMNMFALENQKTKWLMNTNKSKNLLLMTMNFTSMLSLSMVTLMFNMT